MDRPRLAHHILRIRDRDASLAFYQDSGQQRTLGEQTTGGRPRCVVRFGLIAFLGLFGIFFFFF